MYSHTFREPAGERREICRTRTVATWPFVHQHLQLLLGAAPRLVRPRRAPSRPSYPIRGFAVSVSFLPSLARREKVRFEVRIRYTRADSPNATYRAHTLDGARPARVPRGHADGRRRSGRGADAARDSGTLRLSRQNIHMYRTGPCFSHLAVAPSMWLTTKVRWATPPPCHSPDTATVGQARRHVVGTRDTGHQRARRGCAPPSLCERRSS